MFEKFGNSINQLKMMQELMKDENFRALMSNPKVREVFMDPEFQKLVKENNLSKVITHPKFSIIMSDPDIMQRMSKLNLRKFQDN